MLIVWKILPKCEYRISSIRCCGFYFFIASFVWLLFKGSIHFFRKPAGTNNGWISYTQVRRWRLLDTVSSMRSLSVLLSAMEMSCATRTALALTRWLLSEIIHICVLHIVVVATIQGWHLLCSEPLIVQHLFEGSDYSIHVVPSCLLPFCLLKIRLCRFAYSTFLTLRQTFKQLSLLQQGVKGAFSYILLKP